MISTDKSLQLVTDVFITASVATLGYSLITESERSLTRALTTYQETVASKE